MKHVVFRSTQLIAVTLIGCGLYWLHREPLPSNEALISVHKMHYYGDLGLIVAGLAWFDVRRFGKWVAATIPLVNAWKGKSTP